jgi:general secretion pathway protein K
MKRGVRGAVLLQVLIVVTALVAIVAVVAANHRQTSNILLGKMQLMRADAAARAGLNQALASLTSVNTAGQQGDELFDLGNASFRFQIIDAGSLIDINTASSALLLNLSLTDEQSDSLLDWKDPAASTRQSGADDAVYTQLSTPYQKSSRPLRTLSELLLVNAWTPSTLYGSPDDSAGQSGTSVLQGNTAGTRTLPLRSLLVIDAGAPNTQGNGNQRVNVNQQITNINGLTQLGLDRGTATNLQRNAPWENFRTLFQQNALGTSQANIILNSVGFTADTRLTGKINLNTAPQAVLELLPDMTAELVTEILSRQSSGISNIGEIATFPNADYFTVGSDTFIIRALGIAGQQSVAIEATVRITNGTPQIVNLERFPASYSAPEWWQWTSEPTVTTQVLGQTP